MTFSAGIISQVGGEYQGQKTLQITAYISNGNSGGPLLNQKGEIIGINTYGYDSVNKSIFSDYTIEAADRMDVPYTFFYEDFGAQAGNTIPLYLTSKTERSSGVIPHGVPSSSRRKPKASAHCIVKFSG